MSDDEVMTTDPDTGAMKAGNDERYDLIPTGPLRKLARHFGIGARKYKDRNWEAGYAWSKSYASLNRHMVAFWSGEDIDPDTGTPHIIAAAWHCFALAEYMETHPEKDDRPRRMVGSVLGYPGACCINKAVGKPCLHPEPVVQHTVYIEPKNSGIDVD